MRKFLAGLFVTLGLGAAVAQEPVILELAKVQTAVLDPVRWDKTIPGELYFDAIRPLLVRFPGAAEMVRAELAKGFEIQKAELVLEWANQETDNPERGRSGWGAESAYKARPGKWHVLARALLRPWSTDDPQAGPTFEAFVAGAGYWDKGGARGDGTDRAAAVFGPAPMFPRSDWDGEWKPKKGGRRGAEVDDLMAEMTREKAGDPAASNTVARLEVTRVFTDEAFGAGPGARLRRLEGCGFQVHKAELYDMSYRVNWNGYDWAVSTGYMKMWTKPPRLVLTLVPAKGAVPVELPPAVSAADLAAGLKQKGGGVSCMAFPANRAALAAARQARPAGIPDWMWTRIGELRGLAPATASTDIGLGLTFNFNTLLNGSEAEYAGLMAKLLAMPPRHWYGHPTSDLALLAWAYRDFLPPAVQDHLRLYWQAWLHPDVEKAADIGNQSGVPSYVRGYCSGWGTMNFGHNACAIGLLASQFTGAEYPLRDSRRGVEYLQREWGLGSGAHQEIGDTYYQAITLLTTGFIEKEAVDPVDRLLGRVHRDRLIEPLASMYHPGLRRLTHPMGRGLPMYHFLLQEGPYHILHSLSREGTLIHLADVGTNRVRTPSGWGQVHGMSILGDEAPPYRVSLMAPWTEPYLAEAMGSAIDGKKLPASVFAVDNSPGCLRGGWHVNHLGRHYALASRDNANGDYGLTSVVGQWRRKTETVNKLDDTGTLLVAFGADGSLFPFGGNNAGHFGIVQKGGKLVALKGIVSRREMDDPRKPRQFRALAAMAGIFSFGDTAEREVWINGVQSAALSGSLPEAPGWEKRYSTGLSPTEPGVADAREPVLVYPPLAERRLATAKDGDVIAIRDGVTFLGLIPIVVNPLKRDCEVEFRHEPPFLYVSAYLYRDVEPLKLESYYGAKAAPTAGFVVELADATEYESFAAFRQHMASVKTAVAWNSEANAAEIVYTSGGDTLEMTFDPARYPAVARKVNGAWPYLPEGVLRESSLAIQGSTGKLTKNGAVLECEAGRTAYLIREEETSTTIGYNPLPDAVAGWTLRTPEGVSVKADGKVGLLRVTVQPAQNRLAVDYAVRDNQKGEGMARALTVEGLKANPEVMLNDRAVQPRPKDGTAFDIAL